MPRRWDGPSIGGSARLPGSVPMAPRTALPTVPPMARPGGPQADPVAFPTDSAPVRSSPRGSPKAEREKGGRGRPGFGPPGGFRGPPGFGGDEPVKPGRPVKPSDVRAFPDRDLYDPDLVRTLFLKFESDDWEAELEDLHGS